MQVIDRERETCLLRQPFDQFEPEYLISTAKACAMELHRARREQIIARERLIFAREQIALTAVMSKDKPKVGMRAISVEITSQPARAKGSTKQGKTSEPVTMLQTVRGSEP